MTLSTYDVSVPVYIRNLKILSKILQIGEKYADENGLPHSELLEAKLIADMGGLIYQIQRVSDTAKMSIIRLGGVPNVPMSDDEVTFKDLYARIQKTIDFLENVDKAAVENQDGKEVTLKSSSAEYKYQGAEYLMVYALPNFFFHVTTAYDILRHKGVPVGKQDYLGRR